MVEEPSGRVSDELLGSFIAVSDKRMRNLEDVIIGPPIRGATGAEILNGDGLPMRDSHKGIDARFAGLEKVAKQRTLSRTMRLAILSASAVVVASGIPDLFDRIWP